MSLSLAHIKPGQTGYFVGRNDELKPGSVVKIVRSQVGKPRTFSTHGEKLGAPQKQPRRNHQGGLGKQTSDFDTITQQAFRVDQYTLQPDGTSLKLSRKGVSDELGFNSFTGSNTLIVEAEKQGDQVQVGERRFSIVG